jgi:hypothetical protein
LLQQLSIPTTTLWDSSFYLKEHNVTIKRCCCEVRTGFGFQHRDV